MDNAMEKIREIPISITPIQGTETVCLRLVIPANVVDKLGIESTKKSGVKCILYAKPPLDKIKFGEPFELIYAHPGCKPEENKKSIEVNEDEDE